MMQNSRKTLGFKKNMVYKFPLWGGNPIQPVAYVVSAAQETGLNLTWQETPKTGVLHTSGSRKFCKRGSNFDNVFIPPNL